MKDKEDKEDKPARITLDDYKKVFDNEPSSSIITGKSKRELAYNFALDIRKFEIELYWKMAGYF
ncbi:MAG: hypothetical protein HY910_12660 [Desulfarculus sp.]|nr:hypothetical protein [Desulfarculus sp.]